MPEVCKYEFACRKLLSASVKFKIEGKLLLDDLNNVQQNLMSVSVSVALQLKVDLNKH